MTNSPFFSSIDYNEISTLILFNVLNQRNTIKDIVLFCYVIMSCMLYESNSFDEQIFYVHQLGHFNYRDIVHFFLWTFLMIMRYKKENEIQSEIKFCNEMISYIKLNNILPLHETMELIRQVNVIESKNRKIITIRETSSQNAKYKKGIAYSIVIFEVKENEIRSIKEAILSSLHNGYEENEDGSILINYNNKVRSVVFYILTSKHTRFVMKELCSPIKMINEAFSLMKDFSNMLSVDKVNNDRLLDLLCSIVFYFNLIDIYKDLKIDFILSKIIDILYHNNINSV